MKNKIINITILVLLAVFILIRVHTALNQMNKGEETKLIEEFPVVYSGVIPCADCPGIDYTLVLEENRFTEWSHYIDRGNDLFRQEGNWTIHRDTLKLFRTEDDIHKAFLFSEDELTMLDRDLQLISGELEDSYRLSRSREEESIRKHHSELRKRGVDFLASGNEPFWSARIDHEEQITFSTPELEKHYPISSFTEEIQDETKTYSGEEFSLTYTPGFCRDSMSGFLFTHHVTVNYTDRTLTGCGKYL
ncbi:copper resistance protein NlpE N-terminal domain-containing protein [Rhodohalobacter halophilus]|uniref:copper resistance protein NlpE N-terminal domain-containing protein n=1 Tax=Rhodohalobacter halophilus TaxID=1812810 RepID=UPI00083F6B7F|nr:copper resistance protein NlpE N-terminal domain-containing protein [Rhodohalobacter halophilus]